MMPQLQFQIDRPSIEADVINSCDLRQSKDQKISTFQNGAAKVKESPDKKTWNKNI
jgi:hypothetical protein